jgi:ankyrin repeat protein
MVLRSKGLQQHFSIIFHLDASFEQYENTALYAAALDGHFAVVKHLVEAGANKHVTDEVHTMYH